MNSVGTKSAACLKRIVLGRSPAGAWSRGMAGESAGLGLGEVVAALGDFAPASLAESWDNVGLLVEPATPRPVRKALLTIDLTEAVMREALGLSVDLIVAYHPPIFAPLKSVTSRTWKERLIASCLENRIAVYSPHTSYDAKVGGVNDWLAAAFETKCTKPLIQSFKRSSFTHRVDFTFLKGEDVTSSGFLQALRARGPAPEGSAWRARHTFETGTTTHLTVECPSSQLALVTETFTDLLPENTSSCMSIAKVEEEPLPGHGMGRLCELQAPVTVRGAVSLVKQHVGVPHVRLALAAGGDMDSEVRSVAVCAGSGGAVLRGACADLWLTGEMQHHDVLEATQGGAHVVLCNHSDSERGFLGRLAPQLCRLLRGQVAFLVAASDRDPLATV
ncbi:NIF3-like protein 1 [Bacillus rossius redtenbacheri]|uniref:NIF3-like protein 1 n=1 Tax=Bacillus rossius redtenbacheri TaxID=93214 RepID=UPI002FDD608F